jgi:hypothetical protein
MSYEDPRTIKDPGRARAHRLVSRVQGLLLAMGAPAHEIKQVGIRTNVDDEPHVYLGSLSLDTTQALADMAEGAKQ